MSDEAVAVAERLAALARNALAEVTDPADIGELVEVAAPEPGVTELAFATTMPGYVGWRWTVAVATLGGDAEPTVLEVELLPADGALVAPAWVPWADRLAEWRATHPDEAALATGSAGTDDSDDEDDEDEDPDEDLDDAFDGDAFDGIDHDDALDDAIDDDAIDDDAVDEGMTDERERTP